MEGFYQRGIAQNIMIASETIKISKDGRKYRHPKNNNKLKDIMLIRIP